MTHSQHLNPFTMVYKHQGSQDFSPKRNNITRINRNFDFWNLIMIQK